MTRILLIIFLSSKFASGQTVDSNGRTIEQIAVDYFINNLKTLEIKSREGYFHFDPQKNIIWYKTNVFARKGRRVRIPNAVQATETEFFNAKCDKKDIFIMVSHLIKIDSGFTLDFYTVTQINNYTGFTIYINNELVPTKIEVGTYVHPPSSTYY